MKSLLKKARENKKGFTLAELLVVVAIVGILVAISIPVFTAQLGKARRATNQANLRAAKAAAVAEYLTSDDTDGKTLYYEYNISTGSVGEGKDLFTSTGYDKFTDITDKDISALKTYKSICVKISATKDTTEGAVSGVGNESVTLYAK